MARMRRVLLRVPVSRSIHTALERYGAAHGVELSRVVEDALLHHLEALRELPAELVVPPRLELTARSFGRVVARLRDAGRPTRAMRALRTGKPLPGEP
jgi:hypothetical protein